MIRRQLSDTIHKKLLESNKIIVLYGPRQVGKTTLVRELIGTLPYRSLSVNADELLYQTVLSGRNLNQMKLLVEGYDLLFVDEAQRIPDVGINLKILHDALPNLKIIATGSSSFELANKTKEALTGRTWTYELFPISLGELRQEQNAFQLQQRLEELLRFGSYPDTLQFTNATDKVHYLRELSSAYLYKDILEMASIRHADKLRKLIQLLAFQVGSEVSLNEIGNTLGMSKDTVNTYIDLLEKAFVVFRLSGFSRNLRKEISKMDKIYFYDLGIRNVVIDNFQPLDLRTDVGALWENFLVIERRKRNAYTGQFANTYFWRTYTGAELDYVEEANGQLSGFEFKFSRKSVKAPASWIDTYPGANFQLINQENYLAFVID
ncbi:MULTISPECIES: ATP-binding protein [unclassified Spirosoma]|uniref:ATP-binding protein n=1 Tax=unclassified Spirosoma TaxID=2621999 RepID=UPI00095ACFA5|nr:MULTISPECIES: ATP-binding protein [unclassified Spirosoma]MBN8821393.1 ATP-binding protein [Spirosoma sp.]OJW78177.1 MAG: AAA family ATPase [Spirosoma sp. 48-14]